MSIGVVTNANKHNVAETINVKPRYKTSSTPREHSAFRINLFWLAAAILTVFKKGVEQNWK